MSASTSETPRTSPLPSGDGGISPQQALRLLQLMRSAGGALLAQLALHAKLARVEWAEEKARLSRMLILGVVAFAGLLSVLMSVGAAAVALSWSTPYRIPVAVAVVAAYLVLTIVAVLRLRVWAALGGSAFQGTREELAADIDLLRSRL